MNGSMDILDMEGQTAPESTRGLFDPAQEPKSLVRKSWSNDKRHSAFDLSNGFSAGSGDEPSVHSRSKAASFAASRSSLHHQHRSALHTVNEEGDGGGAYAKRLHEPGGGNAAAADSVSVQRKHRSSALFNNFPMGTMGQLDSARRSGGGLDDEDDDNYAIARADALAEAEAKLTGAYTNRHRQQQQQQQTIIFADGRRYKTDEPYQEPQQQQQQLQFVPQQKKYNRRLSEPSTRPSYYRHLSDADQYESPQRRSLNNSNNNYGHQHKQTSLQWPPRYEDSSSTIGTASVTAVEYDAATEYSSGGTKPVGGGSNKPAGLTLDTSRSSRRSSRNYGTDWRASNASTVMSPAAALRSPTSNRSSYTWVPFTPTNVSFPREDQQQQQQQQQRRALFVAHLPFSALVPFLKQHQLVSGILRVNKRNRSDAYVFCDDLNADIYICGSRDRNRALEGDVVAIKLVEVDRVIREKQEKEQAKVARNNGQPIVRKPDEEDEKEIMFGGEEDVDKVKPKYCGIVVAILERAQSQVFSGTLGLTRPSNRRPRKDGDMADDDDHSVRSDSSPRIVWFKPTDKRVPLIAIPVEQAPQGFLENSQQFENRLFLGSIKRWPITSLHPFGVLENELGHVHNLVVQFRAILADNNFSFDPFGDSIMACLPSVPWACTDDVIRSRLDLRAIRTITISNNGVLDNALSIKHKNDNIYEVGLHVADFAAFVRPHSAMDKEAKARAAAVYLYESAPLWPEELLKECTDLVARSTRLAFSVIWKIDQSGKVIDTWYGKTVIESHGVLATSEVQDILDGNGVPSHINLQDHEKPLWEDDINMLYSLSQSLKQARRRNGAMFLSKQALNISIDGKGQPTNIKLAVRLPADDILDEFSILANTGVAHKISSHFPDHALLQSQALPNERKLRELSRYLRGLGYSIDPSTAQSLQQTVDAIENEAAKTVIATLVLKTMCPSKFFCTGKFDINRYHHYSFNAPLYTQFTCPSRSYADIIVHRQLEAVLAGDKRFYLENEVIQKIARHCNVKGQSADNAREQAQHLFMSQYLARLNGNSAATTHEAIVVGVQDQAFDVIVPGLGLERRIHVINLPLETFKYNPVDGVLHLFWMAGVATADAMAEQADAMAELEEDDDDDDDDLGQLSPTTSAPPSTNTDHLISDAVHELSVKSVSSPPSAEQLFTKKRPRSMSLRVIEGENPWTSQQECTIPDESRQVIRPFDYIRVVITSDPDRSPPLIRVLAANPFV